MDFFFKAFMIISSEQNRGQTLTMTILRMKQAL